MTASLYGVVVSEEVEDWGLLCALGGQELMREVHDAVDVAAGCGMGWVMVAHALGYICGHAVDENVGAGGASGGGECPCMLAYDGYGRVGWKGIHCIGFTCLFVERWLRVGGR
ncbi:hypothetical protein I7I51_03812 [Histoplasma capsulatum]|uniref:Uncharacterized protein n=1 Tax=Ajellomyces capsulatus TaxID=5037 RepID=A0A8A1M7H3_AJECA|nr:predicted protein [Histoplasma mississippiense (nom. inval.)]EDN08245.1 predicted protein [Histoplasma mississippiense (nom. inval.)]QSS61635.1 hypothetical protein I7I51_03812 [Histoplasma capsulatum]